jgi:hypothetical protein
MSLTIHIDRLVLDGLPVSRAHGPLVQAAVEAELSRLFTEGGLALDLISGGAVPSIPGRAISVADGIAPAALGQQVARAVYGGIGS